MRRTPLIRKTRLSPKSSLVKREVPEWKRVSVRVRSEPSGTARDPAYLAWVREHRCEVPGCRARRIEAHHFGKRGKSTKCSDYETVPLCTAHHREFHDRGAIGEASRGALVARWWRWAAWCAANSKPVDERFREAIEALRSYLDKCGVRWRKEGVK